MENFPSVVLYFLSDQTFDRVQSSDIKDVSSLFLKLEEKMNKIRCEAEYDCVYEEAVVIQACRSKEHAEKIVEYCIQLRKQKKYSIERILEKLPRQQSLGRNKLTPIKCLGTDFSDEDNSYSSSSHVVTKPILPKIARKTLVPTNPESSSIPLSTCMVIDFYYC